MMNLKKKIIMQENLINDIVLWIKRYCEKNKLKSLIIGVSGGIDSALVSTLCAKTGIKTYCVILPLHQKQEQTDRGDNHVDWLSKKYDNVTKITIDLTSTFDIFKSIIPIDAHNDLAFANSKSRLRMVTLYQIAQANNGIVVGTGNKIEDFGVGFFTKYGDGGVDISPIADLYKSTVYELAKILEISEEILTARPTDGLWDDDRDDETQLGVKYDELEWAMDYLENPNKPKTELTDKEKNVLNIFKKFNKKNKHKMGKIPVFKIKNN